MKKVIIVNNLIPLVQQNKSLLNRADIRVFSAATTDEILKIHIEESVDLIVTSRDLPGTSSVAIFDIIWQSQHLKGVLVIMICEDDDLHRKWCKQCGVHAILALPVDTGLLQEKVRQFLNVAYRQAYRVPLNVSVEGKFKSRPFLCHMEDISATGALIRAKLDLETGDHISCSFYLPDGPKVNVQAEVVRAVKQSGLNETFYGIRYTLIQADIVARIEAYIKKKARE